MSAKRYAVVMVPLTVRLHSEQKGPLSLAFRRELSDVVAGAVEKLLADAKVVDLGVCRGRYNPAVLEATVEPSPPPIPPQDIA